jgi:hypothetical protein
MEIVLTTNESYKKHINILNDKPLEEQKQIIPDEENKALNNVLNPLLEDEDISDNESANEDTNEDTSIKDNETDINDLEDTPNNDAHIDTENIFNLQTTLKDMEYGTYESNKFIEDLILENTHDNNLCSDISAIDLTKYFTHKEQKLTPSTDIFIDNIRLFRLFTHRWNRTIFAHRYFKHMEYVTN